MKKSKSSSAALVVFLVAALGVAGASAATSRHTRHRHRRHHHGFSCPPSGTVTIASSPSARVYRVGEEPFGGVFGCVIGGTASYELAPGGQTHATPVVLVGQLAAYGLSSFGVDTGTTSVVVRRLSDGAQLLDVPAVAKPYPLVEAVQGVTGLVLAPDGAVAWIGQEHSLGTGQTVTEVVKDDASGETVLDSGAGIDTSSLQLSGSTVTWLDAGVTKTATLG